MATELPWSQSATPVADSGSVVEERLPDDEDILSRRVTLADMCARAAALYAHRQFEQAADTYAQAASLQAELNGELDPANAEILYLYGRSLFRLGQTKSDVLGGRAPAAAEHDRSAPADKQPLLNFSGDENFVVDEEDDDEDVDAVGDYGPDGEQDDGEHDQPEDPPEDDLQGAFEALDLSSILFRRRLEALQQQPDGQLSSGDEAIVRHIQERLGETHDYLAEISLENERYPNAIEDCRASLCYKIQIYPDDSELVAEAHYKLSLALEFASVTTTAGEDAARPFDEHLRDEAASEMEAAIASTRLKLQSREVDLASTASPEDNDETRAQIAEVKEIIADMEQRLADLRKPPIDVSAAVAGAAGTLGSLLGAVSGESAAATEDRVEQAKLSARDLSGQVRKKAKAEQAQEGGLKRKADDGSPPIAERSAGLKKTRLAGDES